VRGHRHAARLREHRHGARLRAAGVAAVALALGLCACAEGGPDLGGDGGGELRGPDLRGDAIGQHPHDGGGPAHDRPPVGPGDVPTGHPDGGPGRDTDPSGNDASTGPDATGGDGPGAPDLWPDGPGPGPDVTPPVDGSSNPAPVLSGIDPTDGLASDASTVTFTGSNLVAQATLTVAGVAVPSSGCDYGGVPARITCTVPARSQGALRGDVTVTNPDGQSATLTGAWTYTAVSTAVDFCNIQFPHSLTVAGGNPAHTGMPVDLYSQLYVNGLTTTNSGPAPGVTGQLGVGPDAAAGDDLDPTRSTRWRYFAAAPNPNFNGFGGNNDEYFLLYTPPAAGSFRYVFRYSLDGGLSFTYCDADDSQNGFAASSAGMMDVVTP
jgi:hypothetical protein